MIDRTNGNGVVKSGFVRLPMDVLEDQRESCRTVSRRQSMLYQEFGGVAAGPLAKLDAEVFAYIAFRCAGGTADVGTPLSAPYAARAMTKILKRPVTENQARRSLERLTRRDALQAERLRFRGHGTNWYRPNLEFLVFVSALESPVRAGCVPDACPTRSRDSLTPSLPPKNPPSPPAERGEPNSKSGGAKLNPRALGTSPRQLAEAEEKRKWERRREFEEEMIALGSPLYERCRELLGPLNGIPLIPLGRMEKLIRCSLDGQPSKWKPNPEKYPDQRDYWAWIAYRVKEIIATEGVPADPGQFLALLGIPEINPPAPVTTTLPAVSTPGESIGHHPPVGRRVNITAIKKRNRLKREMRLREAAAESAYEMVPRPGVRVRSPTTPGGPEGNDTGHAPGGPLANF